jgi:hypothetical protein
MDIYKYQNKQSNKTMSTWFYTGNRKNKEQIGNFVLKKSSLNKKHSVNFGGFLCLVATVYFIYYLLIEDKLLPLLLSWSDNCAKHWHILTVGLMPVYLAVMIFGAAVLSIFLGSVIQRWLLLLWSE